MDRNEAIRARLNYVLKSYRHDFALEKDSTMERLRSCMRKQKDLGKSLLMYILVPVFLLIVNRILKGLSDTAVTNLIFGPAAYVTGFIFLLSLPVFIFFAIRTLSGIVKNRKQLPFEKPRARAATADTLSSVEPNFLVAEQKNRWILLRYEEYEARLSELQEKVDEEPPGITEQELYEALDRLPFFEAVLPPMKP